MTGVMLDPVPSDSVVVISGGIAALPIDVSNITNATTTATTLDLEKRFRLLLKNYFLTFGQVPIGLEDEISIALSTN